VNESGIAGNLYSAAGLKVKSFLFGFGQFIKTVG
jgi:hypothetical protein